MFKKLIVSNIFVGLMLLTGCASIDKAPENLDAQAKKFIVSPNYSQVYVYRNETLGAALSMPVTVNGKLAGKTGANSFFKFNLPEGKHTITSQGDESVLEITTKKNKNYFVWQEVKMGLLSGGSKLQLVDDKKGKKGVLECRMIQSKLD